MSDEKVYPTWGYRMGEDGKPEGKIFDLGTGEDLPKGWVDSPAKCDEKAAAPEPPADQTQGGDAQDDGAQDKGADNGADDGSKDASGDAGEDADGDKPKGKAK